MATSIIPAMYEDTGWVSITPLNGLTVGSVFLVRRIGRTVYMVGQNLNLSAANNSGSQIIGQVDSRFRLANYFENFRWDVHQAMPNSDNAMYIIIRQNGNIQLIATPNTAINALFFSTAYPAN